MSKNTLFNKYPFSFNTKTGIFLSELSRARKFFTYACAMHQPPKLGMRDER